jgi:hypothetical protein
MITKQIENETDRQLNSLCSSVSPEEQQKLLIELGNHITGWERVKNIANFNINKILYTVWKLWEDNTILAGATGHWNYSFYTWATAYMRQRLQYEPAKITIDNRIRVYRDFEAEPTIEAPEVVMIPPRDQQGKIASYEPDDWIEVKNPSFSDIEYSKLLVARGTARRGEMTADAWTVLFDPHATVTELKKELLPDKEILKDDFRLFEDNGIVYAYCNGETVGLSQIIEDDKDNPLWERGINQLLGGIEVHTPLVYKK